MHKSYILTLFYLVILALNSSCIFFQSNKKDNRAETPPTLSLYSARIPELINPVLSAYTKKTGVEFRLHTDKAAKLATRLKVEGEASNVDLFLTVDAGNLWAAAEKGLLAPIASDKLNANIPAQYRDSLGRWFGMSLRARTIVYAPAKIDQKSLTTYEDLADSKWAGKLCLRTSKKVYNRSLVASMLAQASPEATEKTVAGWVENLATSVFSNDTKLLEAIADPASPCAVGIVNTYYLGRLLKKDDAFPVQIFWPNQATTGVHVNVSGIALTKYSKNKAAAIAFIEWLSGSEAQGLFADLNMEFPANPMLKPSTLVQTWGTFRPSKVKLEQLGKLQLAAVKLMNEAGYK